MSSRYVLGTTGTSDFGSFSTALYVMQASSSDSFHAQEEPETVPTRDVMVAVPILKWDLRSASQEEEDIASKMVAELEAEALGAVKGGDSPLPLAPEATSAVSFSAENSCLQLVSNERRLGLLGKYRFPINERLAWFMKTCQTIGVLIITKDSFWVASITQNGSPVLALVLEGNMRSKQFENIIKRSKGWKSVAIGNQSIFTGNREADVSADHVFHTYESFPDSQYLPGKLEYVGNCAACGAADRSREHCVPNWIAADHKVIPVTAPIFCVACNNHFGEVLEGPMAHLAKSGQLVNHLSTDLFVRWAVKTALALSLASDIRVDGGWMKSLRDGVIPDSFTVYARTDVKMNPGYTFSVTQFSLSKAWKDTFLFSFAMHGLLMVVARDPRNDSPVLELPQVYPVAELESEGIAPPSSPRELHEAVLERMAGESFVFTDGSPKEVKSKRK